MIFLQILKIIGIVLLCILALAVVLILLILFVPIRYRIYGSVHEGQPDIRAKATYLLGILAANASFRKDDGLNYRVRALWITLFPQKDTKPDHKKKPKKATSRSKVKVVREAGNQDRNYLEEKSELAQLLKDVDTDEFGQPLNAEGTSSSDSSLDQLTDDKKSEKVKSSSSKKEKKKKQKKHKKRKEPLKIRLENLWNNIKKQYRKWKRILTDKRNKLAVAHIKEVLIKILKGISPKKLKFNAQFSSGSPDTTAEILGILAMFPIAYKYRWKINPDFEAEKAYFEGDFDIKGNIFIFKILFPALDLVFDKNCRRLFRMVKK